MARITRATPEEKAAYKASKAIYPLYGYAEMDGHKVAIEDLRAYWDKEDPQYEIMAPSGYHILDGSEPMHSLLGHTLADIRETLGCGYKIVPCNCPGGNRY